jgi:hypothetical protein
VIITLLLFLTPTFTGEEDKLSDLHCTEFVALAVIIPPELIAGETLALHIPPLTVVVPTKTELLYTDILVPFDSVEVPLTIFVVPQYDPVIAGEVEIPAETILVEL